MEQERIEWELLASGYGLIEGPRYDGSGLYFSDVTNGGVRRLSDAGDISLAVPKRRGVGGIALHADGGIVVSGRNICHVRDGESTVLFEAEGVAGFNDIFTDDAGRIYAGSLRASPFGPEAGSTPGELYRIESGGVATRLYGDIGITNGIGFSPDRRVLYHSDSAPRVIVAHDVAEDGSVSGRRVFAQIERGLPDGLAVDEEGGVWVATYDGGCVERYRADGSLDRKLAVPSQAVTSLCFGGGDRGTLYVVTADHTGDPSLGGCVLRARVGAVGLAVPPARVKV